MKGFTLTIILILSNLSTIYSQDKEFGKTDSNSLQLIEYKKKTLYWQKNNADSAINYAKKYLEISQNLKDIANIIKSTTILADLMHSQSNYINEIEILLKAVSYINDEEHILASRFFLQNGRSFQSCT